MNLHLQICGWHGCIGIEKWKIVSEAYSPMKSISLSSSILAMVARAAFVYPIRCKDSMPESSRLTFSLLDKALWVILMNLGQEMESDWMSSHKQGQGWKYAYDPRDGAATRARTVWTPELGQDAVMLMCPRDDGHQGEDGVDTRARAARRGGPGCPRDGTATGARTSRKPGARQFVAGGGVDRLSEIRSRL